MKSMILIFSFYFHLLFATSHSSPFQVFQGTIKTWFNFGISSILVTTSGEWFCGIWTRTQVGKLVYGRFDTSFFFLIYVHIVICTWFKGLGFSALDPLGQPLSHDFRRTWATCFSSFFRSQQQRRICWSSFKISYKLQIKSN